MSTVGPTFTPEQTEKFELIRRTTDYYQKQKIYAALSRDEKILYQTYLQSMETAREETHMRRRPSIRLL